MDNAQRHTLPVASLEALYRDIDNFIADCTRDEVEAHTEAFIEVKSLIHKRIQKWHK